MVDDFYLKDISFSASVLNEDKPNQSDATGICPYTHIDSEGCPNPTAVGYCPYGDDGIL